MSFSFDTTASSSNAAAQNEKWKAQAFLNFWLRRTDGSRVKVGAIPLHNDKEVGKNLIARLQQEGAVEAMVKVLEVDFQLAQSNKPVDLGF